MKDELHKVMLESELSDMAESVRQELFEIIEYFTFYELSEDCSKATFLVESDNQKEEMFVLDTKLLTEEKLFEKAELVANELRNS